MATAACVAAVRQAVGDKITEQEALDILDRVEKLRRKVGDEIGAEERLAKLVAAEAESEKIRAAVARRHAAINARVRDRLETTLDRFKGAGLGAAGGLRAIMRGANKRVAGVRDSVSATQTAYESRYIGAILSKIVEERPHIERLLSGRKLGLDRRETVAFGERVAREMGELRDGGKPGATGDKDAEWLAKVLTDTLELSRRDANALGATIGKIDGYIPQSHDGWRLSRVSEAEWVDQIMPRLDLEKTFPDLDADEARAVLSDIYKTATTGQRATPSGRETGKRLGPASLANSLSKQRVLHFKDMDAWLAYNKQFGYGDPLATIFSHLRWIARDNGAMKVLGPNPEAMIQSLAAAEARKLRGVNTKKARSEIDDLNKITDWGDYKVMTGEAFGVVGPRLARAGQMIRTGESMSKLGGVAISSLTDPVTLANNLRFQGKGMASTYGKVFGGYLRGRGKGEQRQISFLLGEGFDGILDNLVTPYAAQDQALGKASRAMSFFFRVNGLTWLTDTGRAVGARVMAADMGTHAAKGWDTLPVRYRNVLELQGFDAQKWDAVRGTVWTGSNGTRYVTPDKIESLPDDVVDGLIRDRLDETDLAYVEREKAIHRANEREAEWVDKRLAKVRAYVQRSHERLATLRAEAKARNQKLSAEIEDQVKLLDETLDWAVAEADLTARMSGFREQHAVRRLLDDVQDGQASADAAGRSDRQVERALGRGLSAGREIGRQIASARRRASDLRKKVRKSERRAAAVDKRRGEDFAQTLGRREEETRAFIEQMQQRRQARLEALKELPEQKAKRIETLREGARRDLQLDLQRFYNDEVGYSVIESDARTQAVTSWGGLKRGTLAGEAIRMVMQFKAFPVAFTQRILGRAINSGPAYKTKGETILRNSLHFAELLGTLWVAGLLASWGKDIAKGRTPKELWGDEGLNLATLGAAFMQSGGLGIYGDFLFGEKNRFGGSWLENMAGPAIGDMITLGDLMLRARDMAAGEDDGRWFNDAFRLAEGNLPFAGLFYTKAALDMLVLNSIKEALSPGYLRRQEKRMKGDYGQDYFLPRTVF